MKVVMVCRGYHPAKGGIERHVQDLSGFLSRYMDVRVLTVSTRGKTDVRPVDGIEVTRAGRLFGMGSVSIAPSVGRYLKEFDADIYHFHFPFPWAELSWLLTSPSKRLIVTYHHDVDLSSWRAAFYRYQTMKFLSRADRILVSSPHLMRSSPILERLQDLCSVVPFGVDVKKYELTEEVARQARDFRLRMNSSRIVLFVGPLLAYKGLENLIRALIDVQAALIIVGKGEMEEELKELARDIGLASRTHFMGEVSEEEKIVLLYASDVVVLPSTESQESFGLIQLEAMACSRPVISTRLPTGVPFVNLDGVTGLVVEPGSSYPLASALNRLFRDRSLARRMGEAGRKRATEHFNLQQMGQKVFRIYQEVLARSESAIIENGEEFVKIGVIKGQDSEIESVSRKK